VLACVSLIVAPPDAAKRDDGWEVREFLRCPRCADGIEEGVTVSANLYGVGRSGLLALGEPGVLDAPSVAAVPRLRSEVAEPIGRLGCGIVQRGTHCLGGELEPVHHADGGNHVGGVGALAAPLLEEAPLAAGSEHSVEESVLRAVLEEAVSELDEDARVEAGISEVEPEEVLPIDPGAGGLGSLPVGEVLAELEDGDEGEPPRRVGRLADGRETGGEVLVVEDGPELVAEGEEGRALREGGESDAGGLGRDGAGRLWLERHGSRGG
jgi:hypothetical protein